MNELRIYGHSPAALVVCSMCAPLSCRQDPGDDSGGADLPEREPPPADDGDGDGDGDGDDPICDLSQFPRLTPEWIVEVESPIEGATPTVDSLLVTQAAIFASGRDNVGSSISAGFLERRSLSGELEWALELDYAPFALAWDGEHLYASGGGKARRWSADGLEDAWVYDGGDRSISALAVDDQGVAIVGRFTEPDSYEDDWSDAHYGSLTKTVPPMMIASGTHATEFADDYGEQVYRVTQIASQAATLSHIGREIRRSG